MKKLFTLLIALCTLLCFNTVTFAQENNQKSTDYIIQNWIDVQYSGNAEVSEIVSLYSNNDVFIGQLISFVNGNVPSGYIILSQMEDEHPIIEYSLEGQNVYDYLKEQFASYKANFAVERQKETVQPIASFSIAEENVLYTDFINYSLKVKSNNQTFLFNQNKEIQEFNDSKLTVKQPSRSDTFFDDYVDFPSESGSYVSGNITGANSDTVLIMGNMPGVTAGEGNCGPTSLANTVKLYAENGLNGHSAIPNLRLNGSDSSTYSRLVQISGYSCNNPVGMDALLDALVTYSRERNYSCSIDNYWWDLWSDFTRDIGNNKPILLYTSSSAGTAHSQVVVGYRSYNNGAKYLRIFTGWSSSATFVKFKPSSLNNFNGYCVSI